MIGKRIYVAGHTGMVGSALVRTLKNDNNKIITRNKSELNLTQQEAVKNFFKTESLDQVYIAAARVGGINANNIFPAEFIYENIMITANIINSAFECGVKKILFLGSSCIYPKFANQPIEEEALLTGLLEPTNEPYAIAKIAGIKLCESYNRQYAASHGIDYRSIMPTNLYGPGDNYNLQNCHVIPALIRKFHEAKINNDPKVVVWGDGFVKREFLYVDDLAQACEYVMNLDKMKYLKNTKPICSHINVGTGLDLTIKELAEIIKKIVNYNGVIEFNSNKLDGTPRKLLNSNLIHELGWKHKVELNEGLTSTYQNFKSLYDTKKFRDNFIQ